MNMLKSLFDNKTMTSHRPCLCGPQLNERALLNRQTLLIVSAAFLVSFLFALALPAFAQDDYYYQDIEDIMDEITSEDELVDYEDHPEYNELEELFYKRQAEQEAVVPEEDKRSESVFQFKTYHTVNSGKYLAVYTKLQTKYTGLHSGVLAYASGSRSQTNPHFNLSNIYGAVLTWDAKTVDVPVAATDPEIALLLKDAESLGQDLGVPVNGGTDTGESGDDEAKGTGKTQPRLTDLGRIKSYWQFGRRTFRFGRTPSLSVRQTNIDGKTVKQKIDSVPSQKLVSRMGYMSESTLKTLYGYGDEFEWSGGSLSKQDGIQYSRFFGDEVDMTLGWGQIKDHAEDRWIFGGVNVLSGNSTHCGAGLFNVRSHQFRNDVNGVDFYGYKQFDFKDDYQGMYFSKLTLYGEYGYFQNLGDGLYGEVKTGLGTLPGSKTPRTEINVKVEDTNNKAFDPYLVAPFKFTDKTRFSATLKYRFNKSNYLSYYLSQSDSDSVTPGSESQTAAATWYYKPTSRTSFKAYYKRTLPDEGDPNALMYGEIKFNATKKWYIKTKLQYSDTDVHSPGGGTTSGYVQVKQNMSKACTMDYKLSSSKSQGDEEAYTLQFNWTQKF